MCGFCFLGEVNFLFGFNGREKRETSCRAREREEKKSAPHLSSQRMRTPSYNPCILVLRSAPSRPPRPPSSLNVRLKGACACAWVRVRVRVRVFVISLCVRMKYCHLFFHEFPRLFFDCARQIHQRLFLFRGRLECLERFRFFGFAGYICGDILNRPGVAGNLLSGAPRCRACTRIRRVGVGSGRGVGYGNSERRGQLPALPVIAAPFQNFRPLPALLLLLLLLPAHTATWCVRGRRRGRIDSEVTAIIDRGGVARGGLRVIKVMTRRVRGLTRARDHRDLLNRSEIGRWRRRLRRWLVVRKERRQRYGCGSHRDHRDPDPAASRKAASSSTTARSDATVSRPRPGRGSSLVFSGPLSAGAG
jgi:hypothetical protein